MSTSAEHNVSCCTFGCRLRAVEILSTFLGGLGYTAYGLLRGGVYGLEGLPVDTFDKLVVDEPGRL